LPEERTGPDNFSISFSHFAGPLLQATNLMLPESQIDVNRLQADNVQMAIKVFTRLIGSFCTIMTFVGSYGLPPCSKSFRDRE